MMIFSPELSTAVNLPFSAGWIERIFIRLTSMGLDTRRKCFALSISSNSYMRYEVS